MLGTLLCFEWESVSLQKPPICLLLPSEATQNTPVLFHMATLQAPEENLPSLAGLLFPRDDACPGLPGSRDQPQGPHLSGSLFQTLFCHLKVPIQQRDCNTIAWFSCWAETVSKNSGNLLWLRLPRPQNPDPNLPLSSPRTCSNHPLAGYYPWVLEMTHDFLSLLLLAAPPNPQINGWWDRHHP